LPLRQYLYAVLALALAVILAYVLLALTHEPYAGGATQGFVLPDRFRQRMIELDRRALDEAYVHHFAVLFSNWVKDVSSLGHDPSRITKGISQMRQAYVMAAERIEAREEK
jgi:hypothetical protein